MYRYFLQEGTYSVAIVLLALDWLIRIVLGIRVILRRSTVGFTLAWLGVILFLPLLGALIYLLLGERRLGTRRARRIAELREPYGIWLDSLSRDFPCDDSTLSHGAVLLRRTARGTTGIPALPGNSLELISEANDFFDRLIADISAAKSSVHLEFYIWEPGGRVNDVVGALLNAAARGVTCRVLVDDVGADDFIKHPSISNLRNGGVKVVTMLDVGVVRTLFARIDLRNHRKIAVIDGEIGYTGSQNMADPAVFGQDADIGEWIDAMVRVTGPAVEALQVTLLADWEFETYEGIETAADKFDLRRNALLGDAIVQVVPSGPGMPQATIQELILTAIYAAERELVLTSPYFIPDDAMIKALLSAAARGVQVTLVVPRRSDSRVVRLAGEAYFEELLEGGVRITRFEGGVLHTKAITVDGRIAMFGTVNLDMRSFYLNFEISLLVYDGDFAARVRALQDRYIEGSRALQLEAWRARPFLLRFLQQFFQLLSPVL
ncbi:MAG: cardiolipin synthase [Planctomycetes bacterium]|nr:cardiolipin synthase [Planctomycetota bacterium]